MKWTLSLLLAAPLLALPPDWSEAHRACLQGRFADAELMYSQIQRAEPLRKITLHMAADCVIEKGNYALAAEILRNSEDDSLRVRRRMARLNLEIGKYATARKLALEGLKWGGSDAKKLRLSSDSAYANVGEYYLARGDYQIAITALAKALKRGSGDRLDSYGVWNRAQVLAAMAYLGLGQPEDAKKAAVATLEAAEGIWGAGSIPALNAADALGLSELALGHLPEAAEAVGQALQGRREIYGVEHPKVVASFLHGALVHARLGRKDDALKFLDKALQVERSLAVAPNGRWAMELLDAAEIYTLCGKPEEALTCLRNALPVLEPALGADAPRLAEARQRLSRLQLNSQ